MLSTLFIPILRPCYLSVKFTSRYYSTYEMVSADPLGSSWTYESNYTVLISTLYAVLNSVFIDFSIPPINRQRYGYHNSHWLSRSVSYHVLAMPSMSLTQFVLLSCTMFQAFDWWHISIKIRSAQNLYIFKNQLAVVVSCSIRGLNDFLYNITFFGCLSKHFIWTSLYKSKDIISRGYISAVGFHYIFFFVSFFIPSCMYYV